MGGKHKFYIKTDGHGIAHLKPFFLRKGYGMAFEEVDRSRFVFASGNNMKFQNGSISAKGSATLKWIDPEGKGQYIELKVIRHDPPAKLVTYRPKLKIRQDGHYEGFEAKDENVFTLDIARNKFHEGISDGDVVLTVRNLKTVFEAYKKKKEIKGWVEEDFDKSSEWSFVIEGRGNTAIKQKDPEIPTYAPLEGYKKRLTYDLAHCYLFSTRAAEELKKEGWGSISDPEANLLPIRSSLEEDEYQVIAGNQFERAFYLCNIGGKYYGIVHIRIFTDLINGTLQIQPEGYYNPDGSNNLWRER